MLYSNALIIPGIMKSSDQSMTLMDNHAIIRPILRNFLSGTNSSAKLALPLLLIWKNLIKPMERGTTTKKSSRFHTALRMREAGVAF